MAGRNVYLTEKEISALRKTCSEWCEMMEDGDQKSNDCSSERLYDGLGSALKKLYRGTRGERVYRDY